MRLFLFLLYFGVRRTHLCRLTNNLMCFLSRLTLGAFHSGGTERLCAEVRRSVPASRMESTMSRPRMRCCCLLQRCHSSSANLLYKVFFWQGKNSMRLFLKNALVLFNKIIAPCSFPKSMLKMFFLAEVRVDACKIACDFYDLFL